MDGNNFNQNPYQQQGYQQTPYQQGYPGGNYNPYGPELEPPVSVGSWIVTILITCIPCVNLIMLFIWAFSKGDSKSKSNWAKAQLIFVGISVVLSLIVYFIFGVALIDYIQKAGYYY